MKLYPQIAIGEVADSMGGGTPNRKTPAYWGPGVPWFTVADLSDQLNVQHLTTSRESITKKGLNESAAQLIPRGAVVCSTRVVVGKTGITANQIATNQDFISLLPHSSLDALYLAFAILSLRSTLRGQQQGATIKGIRKDMLLSCKIPFPPIAEQRRIVGRIRDCMGRIEESLKLHQESCSQSNSIFPALVEELVAASGGGKTSMVDACDIEGVLVDPREARYRKMLHVGGANIVSETGQLVGLKTAADEKLISGKFAFTTEDVLYSKIRPYLKKVVRPDFSGLCSADIYPLRPRKDKIIRDFLFYLLLSRDFTSYAIQVSNRAGMPKVNREQLFAYEFNLPGMKTQESMVKKLDAAYHASLVLRSELNEVGEKLATIQASVLKQAFAGEL